MSPQNLPKNPDRWCYAPIATGPAGPGQDRATLLLAAKWTPGETITVSFLGGSPQLQNKVKNVALEWTVPGMANLTLDFRANTTQTDIRIAFISGAGSWSYLGTTCRRIPHPNPTMNYGWLTNSSSDDEIRRVVLHEFGHALGLVHEHQHPEGCMKWNYSKVIADLSGPPNNWDIKDIVHNVFQAHAADETNFSAMDPKSIMMYSLPASWTLDGFSVPLNSDLSATDKQFIQQQYP
jgi:hypothetical protein